MRWAPLLRAACFASLWAAAPAGYLSNAATSAANALVVASSGENLACANNAWKTVDGKPNFGCDGATPGHTGAPVAGWNAGPGTPHAAQWLVFDFKSAVTLSGLRFSGGGDKIHDADEMTISTGAASTGPWAPVGAAFNGKAGAGKPNTWNEVWQEFEFPSASTNDELFIQMMNLAFKMMTLVQQTAARFWRWDIKTRHSEWQVWVGEVEFYEVPNPSF